MTSMTPALNRYYEGQSNNDNANRLGISCDLLRVNLMNERKRLGVEPRVADRHTYNLDTRGRKLDSVAEGIEMSKSLSLYYYGYNNAEIADSLGIKENTVAKSLSRERISLGISSSKVRRSGNTAEFDEDRELVMALKSDGMSYDEIGIKWGVSRGYVTDRIKRWTPKYAGDVVKSSDFNITDSTLPSEFTLTHHGRPIFKVTRL